MTRLHFGGIDFSDKIEDQAYFSINFAIDWENTLKKMSWWLSLQTTAVVATEI